jgi:hypothetical protein
MNDAQDKKRNPLVGFAAMGATGLLLFAACSGGDSETTTAPAPAKTAEAVAACTALTEDEVARIVAEEDGEAPNYKGSPDFQLAGTARYSTDSDIFPELWVLHGEDGRTYTFATDPNGMLVGADAQTRKAWVWGEALTDTDSPVGRAIEEALDTADLDCTPEWAA